MEDEDQRDRKQDSSVLQEKENVRHQAKGYRRVAELQEEVEQRTVTLAINTTKMSANVLKSAIAKYLAYRKEKAREGPVKPCGKQSVKQLVGQNQARLRYKERSP